MIYIAPKSHKRIRAHISNTTNSEKMTLQINDELKHVNIGSLQTLHAPIGNAAITIAIRLRSDYDVSRVTS